ncbi:MAG: chemotaxis-specific protein-glutamate methyltransferase CheB [Pseudomonadota bacterium]|jgi:two-component system chemotaxis response regulator CheB
MIRVLVVDDSPSMRALLTARLRGEADIEVVATAADASEARAMIKALSPDVITLDIEMPGMDGLSFLEKIMFLRPTPVIVVSGATQEGNDTTARALQMGAVSCYAKGDRYGAMPVDDRGKLAQLVREAAQVKFGADWPVSAGIGKQVRQSARGDAKVIAIGSSTGGVEALRILLPAFPADCPPTLVVQHVNARFASAIARSLDDNCAARVVLAETDMPLRRGHIYFAPGGDRHMMVGGTHVDKLRVTLRQGDLVSGHRPSVDALFLSVAARAGAHATGVLLTGMGQDGASGLLAMAQAGARTIAQDEASCVVFGMPRAAISMGAAEIIAPLDRIAEHVLGARAA